MIEKTKNLSGTWLFRTDPEKRLEKSGMLYKKAEPEEWEKIEVPSHWQLEGYDYQGAVWYYKSFNIANIETNRHYYIEFENVDYTAEVWLNGIYLGFNEGDFNSFDFMVDDYLKEENHLFVKVESGIDKKPEFKKIIKGGIYHWDCLPIEQRGLTDCPEVPSAANEQYPNPVVNPGGIWGNVSLKSYQDLKLEDLKFPYSFTLESSSKKQDDLSEKAEEQAEVFVKPKLELRKLGKKAEKITFIFKFRPLNFSGRSFSFKKEKLVLPGINSLEFSFKLNDIERWWIKELGSPNLYQAQLEIHKDENKLFKKEKKIAFREVEIDRKFGLYINGKRFYARGTNYLSAQFLSLSDKRLYDQDIKYMIEANINMVRLFSHLENDYFYECCNREGVLIWQDLPFQWGYSDDISTLQRSKKAAEKAVSKLYDHPALFNWCLHSESRYHDYIKLDRMLENTVEKLDPSRPLWKNSVFMTEDSPPDFFESLEEFEEYNKENSSVNWIGWYLGKIEDAEKYNPLFITEFGSQSLPNIETLTKMFSEEEIWPPDWEKWKEKGFQKAIFKKNIGLDYESYQDLEELIDYSQLYQVYFYKKHIEAMRRKKYNKNNGIIQFHFVSTWASIDWSIIDHERRPKKAYYAVKESFQRLLPSFRIVEKEGKYILEAWIINDYHRDFKNLKLKYKLKYNQDLKEKEFEVEEKEFITAVDIEADNSKKYLSRDIEDKFSTLEVQSSLVRGQKIMAQNRNLLFNNELELTFSEKYSKIEKLWGGELPKK